MNLLLGFLLFFNNFDVIGMLNKKSPRKYAKERALTQRIRNAFLHYFAKIDAELQ